ncbi:hypothetical protein HK099_003272 [Clydaea vesicula]|uniref:Ribosomal protein mS38 C-terminal domain-containing protein n=1 Tax=Clydaea vesicula TaxID=447962 RepID=A0AAD5Y0D0_9FUNG|nr:hypothetical protein HK099_003272 [Clydaea vesicula]
MDKIQLMLRSQQLLNGPVLIPSKLVKLNGRKTFSRIPTLVKAPCLESEWLLSRARDRKLDMIAWKNWVAHPNYNTKGGLIKLKKSTSHSRDSFLKERNKQINQNSTSYSNLPLPNPVFFSGELLPDFEFKIPKNNQDMSFRNNNSDKDPLDFEDSEFFTPDLFFEINDIKNDENIHASALELKPNASKFSWVQLSQISKFQLKYHQRICGVNFYEFGETARFFKFHYAYGNRIGLSFIKFILPESENNTSKIVEETTTFKNEEIGEGKRSGPLQTKKIYSIIIIRRKKMNKHKWKKLRRRYRNSTRKSRSKRKRNRDRLRKEYRELGLDF